MYNVAIILNIIRVMGMTDNALHLFAEGHC